MIYFHIVCEAETEDVKLDGKELKDFIWISPEEALKLEKLRTRETIEKYLSGSVVNLGSKVYPKI